MESSVQGVMEYAASKGKSIGEFEAYSVLVATRVLAAPSSSDHQRELAREVVRKLGDTFASFMLEDPQTSRGAQDVPQGSAEEGRPQQAA